MSRSTRSRSPLSFNTNNNTNFKVRGRSRSFNHDELDDIINIRNRDRSLSPMIQEVGKLSRSKDIEPLNFNIKKSIRPTMKFFTARNSENINEPRPKLSFETKKPNDKSLQFFTKSYDPNKIQEQQQVDVIRSGCPWFVSESNTRWVKDPNYTRFSLRNNPHLCQDYENCPFGQEISPASIITRILDYENAHTMEYKRRKGLFKTTLYWPERKQLLAEIEFLTSYGFPNCTLVVSGYSGKHYLLLAEMFPFISIHIYDEFVKIDEHPRIQSVKSKFSDEIAAQYSGHNVLFVSSSKLIGSFDSTMAPYVESDQITQMNWVKIMNPLKSLLSFKLPWREGETSYLAGIFYFPVWGNRTNTETYLVVDGNNLTEVKYDHIRYEQQLFYFNTHARVQSYPHEVYSGEGLDHCYDCTSEIDILQKYIILRGKLEQIYDSDNHHFTRELIENEKSWESCLHLESVENLLTEERLTNRVKEYSKNISRELSNNRTLANPLPTKSEYL